MVIYPKINFTLTEILLVGYLLNPKMVTNYVFSAYMVQIAISFALLSGSAITPSLGRLIGENNTSKAKIIVTTANKLYCVSLYFLVE